MQHIKAWKTSDSKLFESKFEADRHEFFLALNLLSMKCSPPLLSSQIEFLWENRFELSSLILLDSPISA